MDRRHRRSRGDRLRLSLFLRRSRRFDFYGFDNFFRRCRCGRLDRNIDAQFLPQPVGQAVLYRVGMRRHRHAHVL
jgi:hypothetical protein